MTAAQRLRAAMAERPGFIVPMRPCHAAAIERQESQALTFGLAVEMTEEYGAELVAAPGEAWAALDGERVVALFGLVETFLGAQATAWAVLSSSLGALHLPITRFCAGRIARSGYARIEAIVECADAETVLAELPDLDAGELLAVVDLPQFRTPGVRWARATGLSPGAVLRKYGAASATHMLCERLA